MTGLFTIATATIALAGTFASAPVQVDGAVKKPGPIAIAAPSSLRSAVELAGGFAPDADLRSVQVVSADGKAKSWNLYALGIVPTVAPGDTISVPVLDPKSVVFVQGPIANRAPQTFRAGMTLADVLATASPTKPADLDRVLVTRTVNGQAKTTAYAAKTLTTVAPTVAMLPGDRVTVPHARSVATSDRELLTILVIALVVIAVID